MKKSVLTKVFLGALAVFALSSCDNEEDPIKETTAATIDYSSENANSWHNYMNNVVSLLKTDATSLYSAWSTSYKDGEAFAETFKNLTGSYKSSLNCVEQILEGCQDIASEVGEAKIGEPYDLYKSGKTTEAVYAVESWYSWHSRDDYANNIRSIRNSYYGSTDGTIATNSLYNVVNGSDATLNTEVDNAIKAAIDAILAIPQPFRNNIVCTETEAAMEACATLESKLQEVESYIQNTAAINTEDVLAPVVANYVDVVVLPTYKSLQDKASDLYDAIQTLNNDRSNANFSAACTAWLNAREPWESSESFLFGPVDELGLDPNMDSWPLDQEAIVNILNSGSFDDLNWTDGDSDDAVEAAQNVRGFHTLEFLLFKDGEARTIE